MATKKTTKSTTKKAATKKTTAKKTTTKTAAAKSRYDSQTYTLREVTNSSLRALLIFVAVVAVCSFFIVPYGALAEGEELQGGWYIITHAIEANQTELITKYVLTNVIPILLLFVSAAMLLIRTDKFTSFMSIMVTGIAAALFCVGFAMDIIVTKGMGWELTLLFIIIELLFSIALYVASPSYKKSK